MRKRLRMKSWFSARQSEFKPVLQQKKKKKKLHQLLQMSLI